MDQAGKLTYATYLKVRELTGLQHTLSHPPQHDELFFIIVHQVYELWFKQMLHEIEAIYERLGGGLVAQTCEAFNRIHAIQRILIQQIHLLETMFAVDFARFRANLNPASGFQSVQFRIVEFLSGEKEDMYFDMVDGEPEEMAALRAARARPTIYDALLSFLKRAGFDIPDEVLSRDFGRRYKGHEGVRRELLRLYNSADSQYLLFRLCEHYMEYDELAALWRAHHVEMVRRMIGGKVGTGGSSGASYLEKRITIRYFPELWELRDGIQDAPAY